MLKKNTKRIIAIICVICMIIGAIIAALAPVVTANAQDMIVQPVAVPVSTSVSIFGNDLLRSIVISAIIAAIIVGVLIAQLKTVRKHNTATEYSVSGIDLILKKDYFIRKNSEKKKVK